MISLNNAVSLCWLVVQKETRVIDKLGNACLIYSDYILVCLVFVFSLSRETEGANRFLNLDGDSSL